MTTNHEHCEHEHCHHEHNESPEYPDKFKEALAKFDLHLHDEIVQESVKELLANNKQKYNTEEVKRQLLGCIELTTLKVTDSAESVLKWVEKVNDFADANPALPHFAGLCVYPCYADLVSKSLEVEGVRTVCVVGGFPASQTFIEIKTTETALAVHDGAEEVDCVINVGAMLSEDYETVASEIQEIKEMAGVAPLKVILETGALGNMQTVKKAAIMAIYSGADFIKTSTGKIEPAATPEAAFTMCNTIKEYYALTGQKIGFKAAGGISSVDDALVYYTIAQEILGDEWTKNGLFRIGASRLANALISDISGKKESVF